MLLTIKEATEKLVKLNIIKGKSERAQQEVLRRWIRTGQITGIGSGRGRAGVKIEEEELNKFIEKRSSGIFLDNNTTNVVQEEVSETSNELEQLKEEMQRLREENEQLRKEVSYLSNSAKAKQNESANRDTKDNEKMLLKEILLLRDKLKDFSSVQKELQHSKEELQQSREENEHLQSSVNKNWDTNELEKENGQLKKELTSMKKSLNRIDGQLEKRLETIRKEYIDTINRKQTMIENDGDTRKLEYQLLVERELCLKFAVDSLIEMSDKIDYLIEKK